MHYESIDNNKTGNNHLKNSILILSMFFFTLQSYSHEPQVKFYMKVVTYITYNINVLRILV